MKRQMKKQMKRHGLKLLRVKHDLTQEEIAKKLYCSVTTYNLVENGKRRGTQEFWNALQQLFKLEDGEVWKLQNTQI